MGHQAVINSTSYEVTGGNAFLEGTSYKITKGRVTIDGTEYDISFLLSPDTLDLWSSTTSSRANNNTLTGIAYGNGYWVVCGYRYDGSKWHAQIAYTTSLDKNWTIKSLWTNTVSSKCINCIVYENGYFVVGGQFYDSNSGDYCARIAYASAPGGDWTAENLWSDTSASTAVAGIAYGDGCWVAAGQHYVSAYRASIACSSYAASLGGTWSFNEISTYEGYTNFITYANGYWAACGQYTRSSNRYACIMYTANLEGKWTNKSLWSASTSYQNYLSCITYADGYWVVGGQYQKQSSTYQPTVAYAASLSETWTIKNLWSAVNPSAANKILYADGRWIAGCSIYSSDGFDKARVAYSAALDGTYAYRDLWSNKSGSMELADIIYNGEYYVAVGQKFIDPHYTAHLSYSPKVNEFITESV